MASFFLWKLALHQLFIYRWKGMSLLQKRQAHRLPQIHSLEDHGGSTWTDHAIAPPAFGQKAYFRGGGWPRENGFICPFGVFPKF